tara:strand:+ start:339 stop:500 length:162 start_codon:yes stop_codon:yes gene_type:complete
VGWKLYAAARSFFRAEARVACTWVGIGNSGNGEYHYNTFAAYKHGEGIFFYAK